jgi:ABC-type Fe3+/spermidine/putrescine transport system ATPase subunit
MPSYSSIPNLAHAPQLSIEAVNKHYGSVQVLRKVTLAIQPGWFTVLLGPSGSGKTTLLRCIAGIERITSGTIRINGEVVDDGHYQRPPETRRLSMVFQDYALWPHMTALENVAYALRRLHRSHNQAKKEAFDLLQRVGLFHLANRYPSELSGGEQQRVALARALAGNPQLLLFDEPLSNLDATLREHMRSEIASLVREAQATALYITHDQSEAFALADRIGILNHGELLQFATPEDIYSNPACPPVAEITGLACHLTGILVQIDPPTIGHIATRDGQLTARLQEHLLPGTACSVLIRSIAVRPLTESTNHHVLQGIIRASAFIGRGYEHTIELPSGTLLHNIYAEHRLSRNQPVSLLIDPQHCFLFSRYR